MRNIKRLIFITGIKDIFITGFQAYLKFLLSGFAFQGTELIGVAAGEAKIQKKYSARHKANFLENIIILRCYYADYQFGYSVYGSEIVKR